MLSTYAVSSWTSTLRLELIQANKPPSLLYFNSAKTQGYLDLHFWFPPGQGGYMPTGHLTKLYPEMSGNPLQTPSQKQQDVVSLLPIHSAPLTAPASCVSLKPETVKLVVLLL